MFGNTVLERNVWVETNIELKPTDTIEIIIDCYGTERRSFLGQSQKESHIGKLTFLDGNKKDTIYGNGCRFIDFEDAIDYIRYQVKGRILKGKSQGLYVNGEPVELFAKLPVGIES